jgi:hypothetical protein
MRFVTEVKMFMRNVDSTETTKMKQTLALDPKFLFSSKK